MSTSTKKPCIQKRIAKWLRDRLEMTIFATILLSTIGAYFLFMLFYEKNVFFDFVTQFTAGLFGILLGFSLGMFAEKFKDNEVKQDFLNLIHEELNEIRGLIYPQVNAVNLLYTDIWDSAISSGVIRLLTTDQVTKLPKVYKGIKGASYEAEWVRRDFEELESTPESQADMKTCIENKCIKVRDRHYERMKLISKQIDDALKEKWWT